MATYRMNGFAFDRANLAGVDADAVAGLNRFLLQREREINTIETREITCTGGPLNGQTIEIEGDTTAPLCVGQWSGYYDKGAWCGNDVATTSDATTPAPTPTRAPTRKTSTAALGSGFNALAQLLAELGEDPAERAHGVKKSYIKPVALAPVDDFGNVIETPAQLGIYAVNTRTIKAATKRTRGIVGMSINSRQSYAGNAYAIDDFGALFQTTQTPTQISAICVLLVQKSTYTIGRTSYTINATSEAADNLRALVMAKKKWFADKMLKLNGVGVSDKAASDAQKELRRAQLDNAKAAQDVAQVVANATAAAVIEQASEAAELAQVATVTTTDPINFAALAQIATDRSGHQCEVKPLQKMRLIQMVRDGWYSVTKNGIQALEANGYAHISGKGWINQREKQETSIAAQDVASVDAMARELVTCEGSSMGANANSTTSSAQHGHAAGLAHGGNNNSSTTTQATPTARTGQTIAGKSGNWSALFFVNDAGAPSMEFKQAGRVPCVVEFESGKDRMRALQQSAKWADEAAAPVAQAPEVEFVTYKGQKLPVAAARATINGLRSAINDNTKEIETARKSKKAGAAEIIYALEMKRRERTDIVNALLSALQDAEKTTPTPAPQATSEATDTTSSAAKRAPRPYVAQVLEFDLRGITWKIDVSRYWVIDSVSEDQHPDILCWRAYKKGGRYHSQFFDKVAGDKAPRDVAKRADEFCQACIAADMADQTAQATATDTPTPGAPAAPSAGHTPATTGADYTDTRKTSSTDTSGLHDTPQDLEPATPEPTPEPAKPGAFSITITRGEGLIDECGKPATVASFAAADALLMQWSETAPKTGGYNKCDFVITWANGDTYEGRYDLKHHTAERPSLTQHMVDECEFYTGKYCPAHMSAAAYQGFIERTDDETREARAAILATMASMGAYFPKVRPVAIDLRALVAGGVQPARLVGLGVVYCGDRCNSSSTGAITAVEPCDWQGFRLVVTTEDGATHHARPADFGTEPGARYRLDAKNHGAPYLAQLAGAVATLKANTSAAHEQAAKAHAQALANLAREYAHLKQYKKGDKLGGVTLAAANVRILLKQAFPGVKFSVTCDKYSMGNTLNVTWTDGPTYAKVDAIVDKFSAGHFNSMEDIYEYSSSAFTELFGSAKHTSTRRELGDATISAALLSLFGENGPSVEDFRTGKAWRDVNPGTVGADRYADQWAWMMDTRRQAEQTGNE